MTSPSKEEQLNRILYEYQLMESSVQILQQRYQILSSASTDLQISQQTLQDMKNLPHDNPILIPIGGGTFVRGKTGDLNLVVVGIGADISVEMKVEDALKEIANRLDEVLKTKTSVEEQLGQIVQQMEIYQNVANRLSAELQGVS
ncbi:prefoldin subunit alpha [Candidatus Bathyarchaeota archaeon]|nr:prefoldin subunit alpha [Candidatus Bathyarchaeota archaeon]